MVILMLGAIVFAVIVLILYIAFCVQSGRIARQEQWEQLMCDRMINTGFCKECVDPMECGSWECCMKGYGDLPMRVTGFPPTPKRVCWFRPWDSKVILVESVPIDEDAEKYAQDRQHRMEYKDLRYYILDT